MHPDESNISDYWRLCDELSIQDAALLVTGHDPSYFSNCEQWKPEERPRGYEAAKKAISKGVYRKAIEGVHFSETDYDMNGNPVGDIAGTTDILRSTVTRVSLINFLEGRGVRHGFFFPEKDSEPDYLNPKDPRYAPKLAAAVNAWLSVTDPKGKTPKTALAKWLRENAASYGLSDDEGKPNEQGIEEAAKVANWDLKGGAPRTPTHPIVKPNPPTA